jgi:DNA primase
MIDSPVEEIRSRLNITEVIGEYVQLRRAGVNFKAACPFHSEKTASFIVSPAKQIWHCFGCGLGGDIFEFVKQIENVEFAQALRILADRAGVELKKPTVQELQLTDKKNLLTEINEAAANYFSRVLWESNAGKEALEYLRGRGLSDPTIKKWGLGFAPDDFHYLEKFLSKRYQRPDILAAGLIIRRDDGTYFDRFHGRVMFPIHNYIGEVVGFTGRILKDQENTGKYMNSPDSPIYNKSRIIYGLYQAKNAIRKEDRAVIVEGNMDVITSHQAGFTQTIASSGTAFTAEQLRQIIKLSNNVVFALDADNAGAAATQRVLDSALQLGMNVKIAQVSEGKDPDEVIKKGIGLWQKTLDAAPHYVDFFLNRLLEQEDPTTVDGIQKIEAQIVPLINYVANPVIRAHFVRKISEELNVPEKTILDRLAALGAPKVERPPQDPQKRKDRQTILEEQLLGLVLTERDKAPLAGFAPEDFSEDNREVARILANEKAIDPEKLKQSHPNAAQQIDLLTFSIQVEMEEQGLKPAEELLRAGSELKRIIIKKKMAEISAAMVAAEKTGDKQRLIELSNQFTALSRQMSPGS